MKTIPRGRTLIATTAAVAALATVNATPALAANSSVIGMVGVSGQHLGYGVWNSVGGANGNGTIEVYDQFCDGNNGIIAALYDSTNTQVNLVSVRFTNCAQVEAHNLNSVKAPPAGPSRGEQITFRVCKLLPDGTWKDCKSQSRTNS
ncbi:hypothetical protein [Amycolatopsis sp. 195334CR]|uniref:hypothetical protein n=1 Tax=Amycolatopsis sp. 195334CR TaxID=2814588 RepID=UPI001A8F7E44|nr:hypothetical protein [Amycolatopsis sp. 195334CR]MBN6039919.1 hypothetical protein [Amycolatopsis sp. 195334CR]